MLIPVELEKKILAQISSALEGVNGVTVRGAWQISEDGLVRWIESPVTPAFVQVSVGTASHPTFSIPDVSIAAKITLFIRCELDPSGSALNSVAERIDAMLDRWQEENYQNHFGGLDVEGLYTIGEVTCAGGNAPTVSNGLVSIEWPLSIEATRIQAIQTS